MQEGCIQAEKCRSFDCGGKSAASAQDDSFYRDDDDSFYRDNGDSLYRDDFYYWHG
jgi:hypothetical protein